MALCNVTRIYFPWGWPQSRSQTFLSTNFPSLEGCTVAMPVDFQTILTGCHSGASVVLFFSLGLMRLLRVQNLGEFLRQRHTTESPSTSLSLHAIPTRLSSYILHLLLPSSRITWLLVRWAPPNSHTRGEADWLPCHDHWIFVRELLGCSSPWGKSDHPGEYSRCQND